MKHPLFSVVLPTKGRSFLVESALKSVLAQTCADFELILVDNDDGEKTREVAGRIHDPRFRYVRTGNLSMPDNWERGAEEARGEFLVMIEDKQMLKRTALEQIAEEAERTQAESIRWLSDSFDDEMRPARIRRAKGDGMAVTRSSDELLGMFLNDMGRSYKETLPLPQLGSMRRSLINRIRSGPMQRLFHEVSLDVSLGCIQLALVDFVLEIRRGLVLYSSSIHSNGRANQRKESGGKDFIRRLSGGEQMCYDRVPIKTICIPSSVYNDFLRVRAKLGGRLSQHDVNWVKYFVESHQAMIGIGMAGVDTSADLLEWRRALSEYPRSIQSEVEETLRTNRAHGGGIAARIKKLGRDLGYVQLERYCKHWLRGRIKKDPEWRFSNPEEYLAWAASEGATPLQNHKN